MEAAIVAPALKKPLQRVNESAAKAALW